MNRDKTIELATDSGFHLSEGGLILNAFAEKLERFAALVAAAERERCANVCEDRGNRNRIAASLPNGDRDEFYCADDIRALGGE